MKTMIDKIEYIIPIKSRPDLILFSNSALLLNDLPRIKTRGE
jgi:hypothetical protein